MEDNNFTPQGSPLTDELTTILKLANQNMSQLIEQFIIRFGSEAGTASVLGVSNSTAGGTQVVIGIGYLKSISVTVPSTGATGLVYDSDTTVGVGSSVAIGIIPSSGMMTYNWPYTRGLVVQPSSGGGSVISVSYTE